MPGWDGLLVAVLAAAALLFALVAAFAIVLVALRVENASRARRWAALENAWRPPLLAVLRGAEPPHYLWRLVPRRDSLFFVRFLLRYAERVKGAERQRLVLLARPYLPRIAEELAAPQPEVRALAVRALSMLGLDRHAPEVIQALDDPAPLVRVAAAMALCHAGEPAFVVEVIRRAASFEGWSVAFVSHMLAAGGARSTGDLRAALRSPRSESFTALVAAEALLLLRDPGAADVAAEVLPDASDPEVEAAALRVLAEVGRPPHLALVRQRVAASDHRVRAQAAAALARLGREEDLLRLVSLVDDPSPWVALHAVRGLHRTGGSLPLRAMIAADHPRATFARQVLAARGVRPRPAGRAIRDG